MESWILGPDYEQYDGKWHVCDEGKRSEDAVLLEGSNMWKNFGKRSCIGICIFTAAEQQTEVKALCPLGTVLPRWHTQGTYACGGM